MKVLTAVYGMVGILFVLVVLCLLTGTASSAWKRSGSGRSERWE